MPSRHRRSLLAGVAATGIGLLCGCVSVGDGSETTWEPATTESRTDRPEPTNEPTTEGTSTPLGAGPGPLPDGPWPLPLRSASNCPVLPDGPTFSGDSREDWHVAPIAPPSEDPYSRSFSWPVLGNGNVIASNRLLFTPNAEAPDKQLVRAFDTDSGDQTWAYTIGSESDSAARDLPTAPAAWNGLVLVGQGRGVHGIDTGDGIRSWRRSLGSEVHGVVPHESRAYVRAHRSIVALAEDGSTEWTKSLDGFPSTVAVGHRHLYVAVGRRIRALDPEEGTNRWAVTLPAVEGGYGVSRLATTEAGFLAIQNSGDLYAYDDEGERRWRGDTRYRTFVTDGRRVYTRSASRLTALSSRTGESLWELTCSDLPTCKRSTEFGPMVRTGDDLVVGTDDGGLLGVTAADGRRRFSLDDLPRFESLALGPDALYGVEAGEGHLTRVVADSS